MIVKEITDKIENLIGEGHVTEGELITVPGLPRDLMVLVRGCYVGDRRFELERGAQISPDQPNQETYTLYLKYVGNHNA